MFCHRCGTQVGGDGGFCPSCGQSLAAVPGFSSTLSTPWSPPTGITCQTGRWIGAGWDMVKLDIGMFLVLAIVLHALSTTVPFIVQGPLLAGFHIYCMKKLLGRRGEFSDLFTGFNFFIPTLVASLVMGLFIVLGFIALIVPGLVLTAMYMFTYLFIVDKRMDFWTAMRASHAVVKNDYVGFTLFVVVNCLILLLGLLCCVVGVFVAVPVTIAAVTVAYRDIVGFEPRTVATL